jgi:hypothetical protein
MSGWQSPDTARGIDDISHMDGPTTMNQSPHRDTVEFRGLRGRVLAGLLQLGFVRFNRVQLGFVEKPAEYQRFLREVIGPRLSALPGRLGVFGTGEHTKILLAALPELANRIHCFVDNNSALWRSERFDRIVLAPSAAVKECDAFFLSTAVFQHVLRADLRRHGFAGPIVAVDDKLPPSWFLA